MGLPNEFDAMIGTWEASEFPPINQMVGRLQGHETTLAHKSEDLKNVALHTKKRIGKFQGKCNYCGKTGHKEVDCFKKRKQLSNKENGDEPKLLFSALEGGIPEERWVLDSGPSHHMTGNEELLTDIRKVLKLRLLSQMEKR